MEYDRQKDHLHTTPAIAQGLYLLAAKLGLTNTQAARLFAERTKFLSALPTTSDSASVISKIQSFAYH